MMSDSDRGPPPGNHDGMGRPPIITSTTTTTTTASPAYSLDWVKLNIEYFKTLPGILKLAQWLLGVFCMGFGSPSTNPGGDFFLFVVVLSFIITFFWICIYFFSIREGLQLPIPWIVPEFYYTAGATGFYFIAFIVEFATAGYRNHTAAAVFAILATGVYGAGTFFLFKEWKQNTSTTANNPNV